MNTIIISTLSQLKNCPSEIDGNLVIDFGSERNGIIKHLKSLSVKKVNGNVDISKLSKLSTLEGIGSNYFTEINGELNLPYNIKSNLLSILKIRKLTKFTFLPGKWWRSIKDGKIDTKPMDILYAFKNDILECQEELIKYGYKKQAR